MGDFAAPAAAANGSSICINSSLSSNLGGAGIGVNTPNSTPAAPSGNHPAAGGCGGSGGPGGGSVAVPKHSTVVERLRQRIEGCRRHHVNCENRYQQAQVEQLELERRDTVSLYQRTLEQRAKKSGAGTGKQQHPSKAQQDAEAASAEQRNHTLIMTWCGEWDFSVDEFKALGMEGRNSNAAVGVKVPRLRTGPFDFP
ncbi:mastermind-like protein 2 [Cricetulus griseus]|nr:mastermind-like protein 2 [Cricetulus griseus]